MRKSQSIHVVLTPDERQAMEAIARQDRRKLSEAVRELIRLTAAQRGLWPPRTQEGGKTYA